MNKKIEVIFQLFNQLNDTLLYEKNPMVEFFHEMKLNFVKVLNEIIQNYIFPDPEKIPYEGESRMIWLITELEQNFEESQRKLAVQVEKVAELEELLKLREDEIKSEFRDNFRKGANHFESGATTALLKIDEQGIQLICQFELGWGNSAI